MLRRTVTPLLVLAVVLAAACGSKDALPKTDEPTASGSADHDGLTLEISLTRTADSLVVGTVVRNARGTPAHLDADQCGRVTEVVLARTVFEPEGEHYGGSVERVKQIVLDRQRSSQHPDRFAPRRVTGGSGVPDCVRPDRPVTLSSGGSIEERWELPFLSAAGLAAVGSEHTVVRAEAVESKDAETIRFLDILPTGDAEEARKGRNVVVERPTALVLDQAPTASASGPSLGQTFDRMIGDQALRGFISAQPPDSWREADLTPTGDGFEFRAVTTGYERGIRATVAEDGMVVGTAHLPGPGDRSRVFARRPATLPPGIARIPEKNDPTLTDDLIAGRLDLPSGRVVAETWPTGGVEPLKDATAPGSYPVHVTLTRDEGSSYETVAFATLTVSEAPTVRWEKVSGIAVDGATAAFTSAEGSEALSRLTEDPFMAFYQVADDSLTAHEDEVTEVPIDGTSNLVLSSTGASDGVYPVYVGLDAAGKPTRFVMDFYVVHLDWPQ